MHGHAIVQIRFAEESGGSRPVGASTKRRGTGPRVTLEVEREAVTAGRMFVLYRAGSAGVVVAGSAHRERVQAALDRLGTAGSAYRIEAIPIEDAASASAVG